MAALARTCALSHRQGRSGLSAHQRWDSLGFTEGEGGQAARLPRCVTLTVAMFTDHGDICVDTGAVVLL